MKDKKLITTAIISGIAALVIGFYIGGIHKKRKLIGDENEESMLYIKTLNGENTIYERVTP